MSKNLSIYALVFALIVGCTDVQDASGNQNESNAQAVSGNQNTMQSERINFALNNLRYSGIPGFIKLYRDAAVPIMETLVEDGMITNYGAWMHNTGGKYNIRWHLAGMAGTNFEEAWTAIISGMGEADAEALEDFNRNIMNHKDETWSLGRRNVEAPGDAAYVYENLFKVNRADLSEWSALWDDVLTQLDGSVSDGLMRGYIVEEHNMGGDFNWKLVVFFDSWDIIDDAQAVFFQHLPLNQRIWHLAIAHKDELWQKFPEM